MAKEIIIPEIIKADFPILVRKIVQIRTPELWDPTWDKERVKNQAELSDNKLLQQYWFDGTKNNPNGDETYIGTPEDYIKIKDNFDELYKFYNETLDKGIVGAGHGGIFDTYHPSNHAEYIGWLYNNSENIAFRKNIETITLELLKVEIGKEFNPPDVDSARKSVEEYLLKDYGGSKIEWFNNLRKDGVFPIVDRIDFDPNNKNDIELKKKLEEEIKKVTRPITLEEVLSRYSGSKEENEKSFYEGHFKDVIRIDFEKMSDDFKEKIWDRYLEAAAKREASNQRNYSPQFVRLTGLLDIIKSIGKHDNNFRDIYDILRPKAFEKFMIDAPNIQYEASFGYNLYENLLIALIKVQPENELQIFWEDNLLNDKNADRLLLHVNGLARMSDLPKDRKKLTPRILEILEYRNFLEGMEHSNGREVMEMITDHLGWILYPERSLRGTFHNFDKTNGTLDYLDDMKEENGQYSFNFSRFTRKEHTYLSAKYDVIKDSFEGDNELEISVKKYFENEGYKLPNEMIVNSIQGRKIVDSNTKVVKNEDNFLTGKYEGILTISFQNYPFIYDLESNSILIAQKTDIHPLDYIGENKLYKIKSPKDYSEFMPLSEFGKKLYEYVENQRKLGWTGGYGTDLYSKFSEDNYHPLLKIIKAVLIDQKKGLIE